MRKFREFLRTAGSVLLAVLLFAALYLGMSFPVILSGALSVGLYFGLYLFLRPSSKIGRIEVDEMQGGELSLELMQEAERDMRSIEHLLPQVQDAGVRADVQGLEKTGRQILDYLTQHPDRIESAHRFADYYLDLAQKLVSKYVELQRSAGGGSQVDEVLSQTRDALGLLNGAFRKQLERLMEGDLMEVETDIRVLRETLRMEGDDQ